MKYSKANPQHQIIKDIIALDDSFQMSVMRNHALDGRLNCGAGWNVILKNNRHKLTVKFNSSIMDKESQPDPKTILDCIFSDMQAYECSRNFRDFCNEFGYEEYDYENEDKQNPRAIKAYKSCKKTAEDLQKMFSENEIKIIEDALYES